MKKSTTLLSLTLCALILVPPVQAEEVNDYAPSKTPVPETAPVVPPPSLEPTPQGGAGGQFRQGKLGKTGKMGAPGAARERLIKKFDANGDGTLDDGERSVMQAWRAERKKNKMGKLGGLGNGPFAASDGGQSGAVSANAAMDPAAGAPGAGFGTGGQLGGNLQARRQKLLQRFDTNGDGALDATEQAAADAFRQQRRQQRMLKMQQQDPAANVLPKNTPPASPMPASQ